MQGAAGVREQFATVREVEHVVRIAPVGGAAPRGDQPALAELAQVVRDQALAPARSLAQLADTEVALCELAQEPPPQRVAGELQEPRWRGHALTIHQASLIRQRPAVPS